MSAQSDIVPDRQEIWSSIYGALRLACFDKNGHSHFNVSVEGFWRSFFAAVLVAPCHAILLSQGMFGAVGTFSVWMVVVHIAGYTASWILFPLVMFFVVDLIGLGQRYAALIVAINWTRVISMPIRVLSLGILLALPFSIAGFVAEAIIIGLIIYDWFVIRTALQTSGTVALAILLFGLLLNGMLILSINRLL